MIGKRQTCPYCKEKVDLKRMFKNPLVFNTIQGVGGWAGKILNFVLMSGKKV